MDINTLGTQWSLTTPHVTRMSCHTRPMGRDFFFLKLVLSIKLDSSHECWPTPLCDLRIQFGWPNTYNGSLRFCVGIYGYIIPNLTTNSKTTFTQNNLKTLSL